MGKHRVTEEEKEQIIKMRRSGNSIKVIAEAIDRSFSTVQRVVSGGLSSDTDDTAKEETKEETGSEWMQHVTPLHLEKQRLEQEVEQKKEALDAARQEYRNFLATVRQLGEDML